MQTEITISCIGTVNGEIGTQDGELPKEGAHILFYDNVTKQHTPVTVLKHLINGKIEIQFFDGSVAATASDTLIFEVGKLKQLCATVRKRKFPNHEQIRLFNLYFPEYRN